MFAPCLEKRSEVGAAFITPARPHHLLADASIPARKEGTVGDRRLSGVMNAAPTSVSFSLHNYDVHPVIDPWAADAMNWSLQGAGDFRQPSRLVGVQSFVKSQVVGKELAR